MEIQAWITTFRWPLEIAALAFALAPLLIVLRAWDTLPDMVPIHFGISGRPDRWGAKWQACVIPVVSLGIYCAFSAISGTWGWLLGDSSPAPTGIQPLIFLKPGIGLMMTYTSWITVRVARKEAESLNLLIFFCLLALILAPMFGLAFSVKK